MLSLTTSSSQYSTFPVAVTLATTGGRRLLLDHRSLRRWGGFNKKFPSLVALSDRLELAESLLKKCAKRVLFF